MLCELGLHGHLPLRLNLGRGDRGPRKTKPTPDYNFAFAVPSDEPGRPCRTDGPTTAITTGFSQPARPSIFCHPMHTKTHSTNTAAAPVCSAGLLRPIATLCSTKNKMQLTAGRSLQVRASASKENCRVLAACPSHTIAAKSRAAISALVHRQSAAQAAPQQLQRLRSAVLVRSTPVNAASALQAPGQHLQQVSWLEQQRRATACSYQWLSSAPGSLIIHLVSSKSR